MDEERRNCGGSSSGQEPNEVRLQHTVYTPDHGRARRLIRD